MTWITAIDKRFINVGKIMFPVKIEWIQEHFIRYAMHAAAACIKLEIYVYVQYFENCQCLL